LHRQGHAHSVAAWEKDRLVGGLYGVAVGRVFFGESMFARKSDASKVALVHLVTILQRLGVPFIDCQQETEHLSRFGARPIGRNEFAERLSRLVHSTLSTQAWKDAGQAEHSP